MGLDLVNTLIFLWPGMMAMFVYHNLAGQNGRKSEFERTIIGLTLGLPTLLITMVILLVANEISARVFYVSWNVTSLTALANWLTSVWHLLIFMIASLFSSLLVGIAAAGAKRPHSLFLRLWNRLRVRQGKATQSGYATVWDAVANHPRDQVVVLIVGDREYRGFIKDLMPGGDNGFELTLNNTNLADQLSDYLSKVSMVYYHSDSGTTLVFYDMSELEAHAASMGFSYSFEKTTS